MPHPSSEPLDPQGASALEHQLSSVVEQEGVSLLAADGVRLMRNPTHVEVSKPKRRRKKNTAYRERATVSVHESTRHQRDHVADLDRVVVGFADATKPQLTKHSIEVRETEHARSPYVVSLRGLAFAPALATDERISSADLAAHMSSGFGESPNLEAVTSMASDMRADEEAFEQQFTPSVFHAAYESSYGALNRAAMAVGSVVSRLSPSTRGLQNDDSVEAAPEGADTEDEGKVEEALALPVVKPINAAGLMPVLKTALGIAGLLAVATLPANAVRLARSLAADKAMAMTAGNKAVATAKSAAGVPLTESAATLRLASAHFREADQALGSANALAVGLASLVPQTRNAYKTGRALAEIGAKTSEAGSLLAAGFTASLGPDGKSPLDRLKTFTAYSQGALPLLDDASAAFHNVDASTLPEEKRAQVADLEHRLSDGRVAVREFLGTAELLGALLGREEPRRYLVIFQNPAELRATGGFMGSFAEVTLDRGELVKLDVPPGGTYAMQGQLTAVVVPPQPLSLIADRWEFQDANWSPDFSTAAKKIRYFWSKAGGPTTDGVIAINATFVQKLLTLTGPIEVAEMGKTITSDNFMIELQKSVELEYDRMENQPKKILGLLAPKLLERLKALPKDDLVQALGLLSDGLETKEIQASFSNAEEDALAKQYGWNGQLKASSGDALAVIGTNIAGQKTDLSVDERISQTATIGSDGSIQDAVTVTRTHTASKGELFRGVRNVAYMRFYVPQGSTILSAAGFTPPDAGYFKKIREDAKPDVDQSALAITHDAETGLDVWDEGDRTVFGGWSMVDPGQTVTLKIAYRLPFSAFDIRSRLESGPSEDAAGAARRAAYSLLLTSQSGKDNRRIETHIQLPDGWKTVWDHQGNGISAIWDRDMVSSGLYQLP